MSNKWLPRLALLAALGGVLVFAAGCGPYRYYGYRGDGYNRYYGDGFRGDYHRDYDDHHHRDRDRRHRDHDHDHDR